MSHLDAASGGPGATPRPRRFVAAEHPSSGATATAEHPSSGATATGGCLPRVCASSSAHALAPAPAPLDSPSSSAPTLAPAPAQLDSSSVSTALALKAISDKVGELQMAQSEMKSDIGVSWAAIIQAVRQIQRAVADSDHGTELRTDLEGLAESVKRVEAQLASKTDGNERAPPSDPTSMAPVDNPMYAPGVTTDSQQSSSRETLAAIAGVKATLEEMAAAMAAAGRRDGGAGGHPVESVLTAEDLRRELAAAMDEVNRRLADVAATTTAAGTSGTPATAATAADSPAATAAAATTTTATTATAANTTIAPAPDAAATTTAPTPAAATTTTASAPAAAATTAAAAPAAAASASPAEAMRPALDRLDGVISAATLAGHDLGGGVKQLGSMIEEIRQVLDAAAATAAAAANAPTPGVATRPSQDRVP